MIFGGVSLLGGFLALLLPETKTEDLPDTFEEAENIGKGRKKQSGKERQAVENCIQTLRADAVDVTKL